MILSIEALAIIILGGLGSVAGAILGAVFLTLLPEGIRINVSANGRLDQGGWSNKMATFARDSEMKPFILQEELPQHVSALAEGSDLEFNENKHRYGVDWAGNVGLGFWQKACLTTFT